MKFSPTEKWVNFVTILTLSIILKILSTKKRKTVKITMKIYYENIKCFGITTWYCDINMFV